MSANEIKAERDLTEHLEKKLEKLFKETNCHFCPNKRTYNYNIATDSDCPHAECLKNVPLIDVLKPD